LIAALACCLARSLDAVTDCFTAIVFPGATAPIMIGEIGGTLFLSPDLDVRDRKCTAWWRWNRYLKLGWYWNIYAALIPHHRHWLSHSPIVSTLIRAIFLGWPLVLIPTKIAILANSHRLKKRRRSGDRRRSRHGAYE
jgi:uncharacterized metal-binding protein